MRASAVAGAAAVLLCLLAVALSPEALLAPAVGPARLVPLPPAPEAELSRLAALAESPNGTASPACNRSASKEWPGATHCPPGLLPPPSAPAPAARKDTPAPAPQPQQAPSSHNSSGKTSLAAAQRFLKLTWPWYGQLANQLVTIGKAYVIALEWNRTLVLPGLAPSDKHPTARLGFFDIFSQDALARGPVRIMTQAEYSRLGVKPATERCHQGCWCCRQPPRCDCAFASPSAARTLLVDPKFTFLGRKGNDLHCTENRSFFRWLQPSVSIAAKVTQQLNLLGSHFLGVHLRKLKPSEEDGHYCLRKLPPISWWYNTVRRIPWWPTALECYMPPELVACYRSSPAQRLFVGSDGKNASAVARLEAAGALRFQPTAEFGTLRAVLVDLFVLAEAEVFLGNPLSTFSAIICSLREAHGRECPNLLPKLQPRQCQRLPDNTKAFEDYTRAQRLRIANTTFLRPCRPRG